jgi:glycosyltransferase involved in cell wall biosynthesis
MRLAEAPAMEATWPDVGVVVIGRNEGKRLEVCLRSVDRGVRQVVYVDSGSIDGSPALAARLGAEVVELDPRTPFNAGRARTEGFERLQLLVPDLKYVQFVDGDSEMMPDWIGRAVQFLDTHPDVAAVTGRLRERHPERSIYNTLCAMEWDSHPVGEARACGGNAMMRVAAMAAVGSYRFDLVAGEEPELCYRLRAANWRIWQLPDGIAVHDAAITRFGQWWRRAIRSGYGGLQGARLYGFQDFFGVRLVMSAWFWVLGVPLAALALTPWLGSWALLVLLLYPLQIIRQAIFGAGRRPGVWSLAVFSLVIKFPNLLGQMQCLLHQCLRKKAQLIEYKSPLA